MTGALGHILPGCGSSAFAGSRDARRHRQVLTDDPDPDGNPGSTVGAVTGSAADVRTQITLASGALVTANTATDSVTHMVAGGATAAVTVTMRGVDGPGDRLRGDAADNPNTGTDDRGVMMRMAVFDHDASVGLARMRGDDVGVEPALGGVGAGN